MDWDMGAILEDLQLAVAAAEAFVFFPIGVFAYIALFSLAIGYLRPDWKRRRRQVEQRTELPMETLDAMFRVVRNPLYTLYNIVVGLCLLTGVTGVVIGAGTIVYGAVVASQFIISLASICLLLGLSAFGLSFIVMGAGHLTLARTVLTEDRIGRLAEFEDEAFNQALVPAADSQVQRYRLRGLMLFVAFLLIMAALAGSFGTTLASSFSVINESAPSSPLTLS